MACAKPVINTNLPTGVPEVSLDGISGLTAKVDDITGLQEAIKTLWENDELRLKLGAGALERATINFSQEKFNNGLKAALMEIK